MQTSDASKPTNTRPFNGTLSGTTRVSRYQKGKTNLDFTGARDSEWQWHQLGMRKSAPRSRQITTPAHHHSSFLQAGCPSCHPTNSVKALKAANPPNRININKNIIYSTASTTMNNFTVHLNHIKNCTSKTVHKTPLSLSQ